MALRPGGEMARRPLHFIWIVDCSGSMSNDGKIQSLNTAIKESLPHMKSIALENPHADVLIRCITFSTTAQWHIATPIPVEDFNWTDLKANGETAMGQALSMVADQLKMPPMTDRALPPVLILLSDGQPTDDFNNGLKKLLAEPWGKKAVKISISIGEDADKDVLQKFINNSEMKPLEANNPENLTKYIKWVSTVVVRAASAPASQTKDTNNPADNVQIPAPVDAILIDQDDVW